MIKHVAFILVVSTIAVGPSADAKTDRPHACKSHSAKVVGPKCYQDYDGDGRIPDAYPYDYTR